MTYTIFLCKQNHIVVGEGTNGNKASVTISVDERTGVRRLYLGSVAEVKNSTVRLSGNLPDSRTPDGEDLKLLWG